MKKLMIISDKSNYGLWAKIGRRFVRSRVYGIEDSSLLNNFISIEQPELIYFNLEKKLEAGDINGLLQKISTFPLNAMILEANPLKINLYGLLFPPNLIKKIFLPHKALHS